MKLTPAEILIKRIASFLGVFQGLGYALLALISVVLYYKSTPDVTIESFMDLVNVYIYTIFLGPNRSIFADQTLTPKTFAAFAWIYFVLHLGWLVVSISVFCTKGVLLRTYLKTWSYLTFLISLWDFITVVILGADYHKCLSWVAKEFSSFTDIIANEVLCSVGILPVLVIAARGFVLWFVNVMFALVLLKMSTELKKGPQGTLQNLALSNSQSSSSVQPYGNRPPVGYSRHPSVPEPDYY